MPSLALFDFDGTITTHETMPAFVKESTSRIRFLVGYPLLFPLVIGYKIGWVSGTTIRKALVRVAYSGVAAGTLQQHGKQFAASYLEQCLRPEAMQRIQWHRDRGDTIVVVSGGLDVYLRPWAERNDLKLICSKLESKDGRMTGNYDGEQCVLSEKAKQVRERYDLSSFDEIYAYGDTPEDRELLALTTHAFYQEMPATP